MEYLTFFYCWKYLHGKYNLLFNKVHYIVYLEDVPGSFYEINNYMEKVKLAGMCVQTNIAIKNNKLNLTS